MAEIDQVLGRPPSRRLVVHIDREAIALAMRAEPCEGQATLVEQISDPRIVAVRWRQDHAVRVQGRERRLDLSLQLVGMGIDQLEQHAIAMLGAFEHAAEQHLIYPVIAAAELPALQRRPLVVEGEDQIGPRAAQPPCGKAHSPFSSNFPTMRGRTSSRQL